MNILRAIAKHFRILITPRFKRIVLLNVAVPSIQKFKFHSFFNGFKTLFPLAFLSNDIGDKTPPEKPKSPSDYDIEDNILHLITLARMALEKGETDRAEGILEMGVQLSEEHNIYTAMPYMYDILSTIAFAKGDLEKAEQLLVNVIEKLTQIGFTEENNHIIDFKLRLARIYSSYKDNDLAEIGFKNCLNEQTRKIDSGDLSSKTGILYINILFWYGLHKIRVSDYKEAKRLLNSAYEFSTKVEGLNLYQEMVILYTLADLNMEMGDYILALEIIQNAIAMAKGIGSSDLPKCYLKMAKIYMKLNSNEGALTSAKEGLKLAQLFSDVAVISEAREIIESAQKNLKK